MSLSLDTLLKNHTVQTRLDNVFSVLELLGLSSIKTVRHKLKSLVIVEESTVTEKAQTPTMIATQADRKVADHMSIQELLAIPLIERCSNSFADLRKEIKAELASSHPDATGRLTLHELETNNKIDWNYLYGNTEYLIIPTTDGGTLVQERKTGKIYRDERYFNIESRPLSQNEIEYAILIAQWHAGKGKHPGELSDYSAA